MPLAAVLALLFHTRTAPGLDPSGARERGLSGALRAALRAFRHVQTCQSWPEVFCFCLLFVLTAANNYIIRLQKYFWEMGIFESAEVIGGRCRFPAPTPLHHVSVLIQTAFLPHSL